MVGLGTGGGLSSVAHDVSADGSVVVGGVGGLGGFRWTAESGMVGLGELPVVGFHGIATGVSADGSVVVGYGDRGAFIWDPVNGTRKLDKVLTDLGVDRTGWTVVTANGISDDGLTMVGLAHGSDGHDEAWIATIPEPATGLFFGVGLIALAATRRRCALLLSVAAAAG